MIAALYKWLLHYVGPVRDGIDNLRAWLPGQMRLWFLALIIGTAVGFAAVLFRKGIIAIQAVFYQTEDMSRLHSVARTMSAWELVMIPVLGGLAVGLILHWLTPDGRSRSVADVIEGAALHGGRVERTAGIASALSSLITLGTGGSSGREGPVVHLAALISSWVSERIGADDITGRDLLGCAAAAAVSASFNAPIAGAIFALEVVLRHFAVHAFGPIVLASIMGTIVNRSYFGDITEFVLPQISELEFYIELPAFFLLGAVCGVVAAIFIASIFFAEDVGNALQSRFSLPRWLRPTSAGLLLGLLAIWCPPIIGVGYQTTAEAISGHLIWTDAAIIAVAKVVAVAITLGGRMGGGVFSPSLMLGALVGLAFGEIATSFLPQISGEATVYALAGMGALAAAVLGSPISSILIVFEMTGDWQIGIAVMAAVSTSAAIASRLVNRSFFLATIERRNIHLAAGPQAYLLGMYTVAHIMRPVSDAHPSAETCWEMVEQGTYVDVSATLERAMPVFEQNGLQFIPVVNLGGEGDLPELRGVLFYVDALKTYNKAMAAVSAEEHG